MCVLLKIDYCGTAKDSQPPSLIPVDEWKHHCFALLMLAQVTIDAFGGIVGEANCEPRLIYIAATVDQGANMVNAFKRMGVETLLCSGHRLNSAVQWATGVGGSYKADGTGTCKNRQSRELTTKTTAMVGHCSHSVCNNDEFKKVQADLDEAARLLELVRRNDTR